MSARTNGGHGATTPGPTTHKAGLFDIRTVIGSLLLIYGLILLAMGLFADPQLHLTGGINANLWAGIALLVAGGVFMAWARIRPVVVDESTLPAHDEGRRGH